jgi:hypothetical protein
MFCCLFGFLSVEIEASLWEEMRHRGQQKRMTYKEHCPLESNVGNRLLEDARKGLSEVIKGFIGGWVRAIIFPSGGKESVDLAHVINWGNERNDLDEMDTGITLVHGSDFIIHNITKFFLQDSQKGTRPNDTSKDTKEASNDDDKQLRYQSGLELRQNEKKEERRRWMEREKEWRITGSLFV